MHVRRWILRILGVISLGLAIAVAMLWCTWAPGVQYVYFTRWQVTGNRAQSIEYDFGRAGNGLSIQRMQSQMDSELTPVLSQHVHPGWSRFAFRPSLRPGRSKPSSFEWSTIALTGPAEISRIRTLRFPFWFALFVALILPVMWLTMTITNHMKRRARFARNHCQACGYDLRATPDRCPECGVIPQNNP